MAQASGDDSAVRRRDASRRARRARELRSRLLLSDVGGAAAAAGLTAAIVAGSGRAHSPTTELLVAAGTIIGVVALARWQKLYKTSRTTIRSVELASIVRVGVLIGVAYLLGARLLGAALDPVRAALLGTLTMFTLALTRSLFRSWLRARRSLGEYLRPIVVIGANDDAARIIDVLRDHRESGYEIIGVFSDVEDSLRSGLRALWVGDVDDATSLIRDNRATGAVVVSSALDTTTLNRVVRDITHAGGHVHLASGLHGLASDRITSEPIAHEPLLHIHPTELAPQQLVMKRMLDVALSGALLLFSAPVLVLAMVAIRLSDGGPALFRQVRVGRNGRLFEVLKLRTMAVDAEDRLVELADENYRRGPLFKLDDDPRVTRIGRLLRATSIDELPQLWNVLRGEMSLVGPRPALPREVEEFPPDLAKRTNVTPGLTGLWQVEARDNPSFEAYRRLDLFYVDNWTVTFDLVILLATIESELARALGAVARRRADDEVIDLVASDAIVHQPAFSPGEAQVVPEHTLAD